MRRFLSTKRGFTLIEVMMAIAIMTVGAVGIMSLQQAATSANIQSHHATMANEATRIWLDRLRRDGLKWDWDGSGSKLNTDYLSSADVVALGDVGTWEALIPQDNTTDSWAFTYRGLDTRGTDDWVYCTNVRFAPTVGGAAVRTDVRTWWHRYHTSGNAEYADLAQGACAPGDMSSVDSLLVGAGVLRAVYASQLVRPMEAE